MFFSSVSQFSVLSVVPISLVFEYLPLLLQLYAIPLNNVDDCLFFAKTYEVIDEAVQQLRDAELDLNVEEDVAGFFGISTNMVHKNIL